MSRNTVERSKVQAQGLRAAILRLLAAAKSQDSQRAVTVQDLSPAKPAENTAQAGEESSNSAANVEWSLRIMS
jgi:hypothetical protein